MFLRCLRDQVDGGAGGGTGAGASGSGAAAGGEPPKTEPPKTGTEGEPGAVPYSRFKEVNDELGKLRKAEETRVAADLTARGEHEKVAAAERTKREEAEARADRVARRAAFIGAVAGKVADPEAAFKLALADGLVTFDVNEDGAPKDSKAVDAAVTEITKRYPFLKSAGTPSRDFGDDRGGTQPGAPVDPEKLSPMEKMVYGMGQNPVAGRGARS